MPFEIGRANFLPQIEEEIVVYTFDMIAEGGRIDHVQLHHCESALHALCLAEAALVDSVKAIGIEIWQGTVRIAHVSARALHAPALA